MATIGNAPGGELAKADVDNDVLLPVEKLGGDYYLPMCAALVKIINKNLILTGKGANIASASALALGVDGNQFTVTGTTTITSINTLGVGAIIYLDIATAMTFTHHATNLILPDGVDINAVAGDQLILREHAVGKWTLLNHQSTTPLAGFNVPAIAIIGTDTATALSHHTLSGTTSNYTTTLPEAGTAGQRISFYGVAGLTKVVTIVGNGAEKINDEDDYIIVAYGFLLLESTGSGWRILSEYRKPYVSTGQTITSGGGLTLNHSLGVEPATVDTWIECTSANGGYAIGDRIHVALSHGADNNTGRTNTLRTDATSIYIRLSNTSNFMFLANKSSGSYAILTNSKWQLYVKARAA